MKKFEIYGYSSSGEEELLELREVTILADPHQLRVLSEFLVKCAQEMEATREWEHRHFAEGESADIIIANPRYRSPIS